MNKKLPSAAKRTVSLCVRSGAVCHESTVGLSAKISAASAFPTLPDLYDYYTIRLWRLVKNPWRN